MKKILINGIRFPGQNPIENERTEEEKHHGAGNMRGLEQFCTRELSMMSFQVFSKLIKH